MKFINKITDFVENLEKRQFLQLVGGIFLALLLVCGLIIYFYYSKTNSLLRDIKNVNSKRTEARELLTRNLAVNQQREKVDEILKKDKNFKIGNYFNTLAEQQRLSTYVKDKQITTSDIEQGYTEIRLSVSIKNINMKQLVDLLEKIENNERVFTKKLDINKSEKLPVIDVDIVIATLEAKPE